MRDLINKREEYVDNVRRNLRADLIVEKRNRMILQTQRFQQEIALEVIQAQLIQSKDEKSIKQALKALTDNHQQISVQALDYVIRLIQSRLVVVECTNLLVMISALKKISAKTVAIFLQSKNMLIELIQHQDMEVIENVVYILGNMCGEDNQVKKDIINSNFFNELAKIIQSNQTNMEFLAIVLWSLKNALLTNKKDYMNIVVPMHFVEFTLNLIYYIFTEIQVAIQNAANNENFIKEYKQVCVTSVHLLRILYLTAKDFKQKIDLFDHTKLNQIIELLCLKLFNVDFIQDNVSTQKVIIEILSLLVSLYSVTKNKIHRILDRRLLDLVGSEINKMQPKSLDMVETVMQLVKAACKNQYFMAFLNNLEYFSYFLQYPRIQILFSQIYLLISIGITSLTVPKSQLQHKLAELIPQAFTTKLLVLLNNSQSEVVYNSVRTLSNLMIAYDEPVKQFLWVVEQSALADILFDLQLNPNKEIYEEVQKILQTLEITD